MPVRRVNRHSNAERAGGSMPLYKYGKRRHLANLVVRGEVVVGTLYDYRRQEHEQGISDPREGTKTVSTHIDDLHITEPGDPRAQAYERFGLIHFGNATNVRIRDITLSQSVNSPDYLLYCLSTRLSKATMAQFGGADACVEITDPLAFFRVLTDLVSSIYAVRYLGAFAVQYQSREEEWNGTDMGLYPALIKGPEASLQHEVRAIWEPVRREDLAPRILTDMRLPAYCRWAEP